MRENRTSGSEGGGAGNSTSSSYPYLNLFSPFRIRFLVLDCNSNAERGSGGEVEIVLHGKTKPHFFETTNGFRVLIIMLF